MEARCGNAGEAAERLHRLAEQRFIAGDLAGALRAAREAQARCQTPLPGLAHAIAAFEVHAAAAMSRASGGNWYAVLSVGARTSLPTGGVGITHEDIKRRYKRLCLVLHPDKNLSAAAEGAFKLLQEAWKTLSARHPPAPAGAKPARSVPTPPRPPPAPASAARPSSNNTPRPPPPAAKAPNKEADSGARTTPAPPRAFRSSICGHCARKFYFYAAADGDEEEYCISCRERQGDPAPDDADSDTPSPPRRRGIRFPCPGRCAHCGAGYASSMVSVGMWNLHCAACHRYAKVHVRSPSSAEVW
jgi:hypothetical protein